MSYAKHFKLTDDLIQHLDAVLIQLNNPFIESRYTGFLAVSAVTVLELALKTIFLEFSAAKHIVLGNFCSHYFERINGRITLTHIDSEYLRKFGKKYQQRFKQRLDKLEKDHLRTIGGSLKSSYGNLISWRNGFAHEGNVPANATYAEVKRTYECGKQVMRCLASCMSR